MMNFRITTTKICIGLVFAGLTSCTTPPRPFLPGAEPPEPVGGYASIMKNLVYPGKAWEAGIEGTVIIQAYVDSTGIVTETVVLQGFPGSGMDEAAAISIMKTRWIPAKQGKKPVGVWINVPVVFRLENLKPPAPIGGYAAIKKRVVYPVIALDAGVSGTVVVRCYVDETGRVSMTTILKGFPNTGLNESAEEAIKKTPFEPASYQQETIGVWLDISITYNIWGPLEDRESLIKVSEVKR